MFTEPSDRPISRESAMDQPVTDTNIPVIPKISRPYYNNGLVRPGETPEHGSCLTLGAPVAPPSSTISSPSTPWIGSRDRR